MNNLKFILLLWLWVNLLGCNRFVAAEGAGSGLSEVAACQSYLRQLLGSRAGITSSGQLIVEYNATAYGSNSSRPDIVASVDLETMQQYADERAPTLSNTNSSNTSSEVNTSVAYLLSNSTLEDITSSMLGEYNDTADKPFRNYYDDDIIFETDVSWNWTVSELLNIPIEGTRLDGFDSIIEGIKQENFPTVCLNFELTSSNSTVNETDRYVIQTVDEDGNALTTTCVTTVDSLENVTLRVHVIGDETEAYLDESGALYGYVGQTFAHMQRLVPGLDYSFANITVQSLLAYPLSPWSACVQDLHDGRLDVCLGEFFDTPERRELTEMSALVQLNSVVLVAPRTAGKIDFTRLMKPFSPSLWVCIAAVVVLFAVLLWFFSLGRETGDFPAAYGELKRFGHSIHLSVHSLLGAAVASDLSEPSHALYWLLSGYAVFIVVVIAAYTANLAAIMTAVSTASRFQSLAELAMEGRRVCVQQSLVQVLLSSAGDQIPVYETSSAEKSLEGIDEGLCAGAVLQLDAMHFAAKHHCDSKVIIGDVLFNMATGIPIRQRYEGLVSRYISQLRLTGVISGYYNTMLQRLTEETCATLLADEGGDETASLSLSNALPLFIVVGALFFIAAVMHVLEALWRRSKPKSNGELDGVKVMSGCAGDETPNSGSIDTRIAQLEASVQAILEGQSDIRSLLARGNATRA